MSDSELLSTMEAASRAEEAAQRRQTTLDTLDRLMLDADTLPEDVIGTLNLRLRDQVIGACLKAKTDLVGRQYKGPLFPSRSTAEQDSAKE